MDDLRGITPTEAQIVAALEQAGYAGLTAEQLTDIVPGTLADADMTTNTMYKHLFNIRHRRDVGVVTERRIRLARFRTPRWIMELQEVRHG
jgi:hypothetical protein